MSSITAISKAGMDAWIRDYFAACNSGDAERIAGFFEPDAVHYFPGELFGGPCRGAGEIGQKCRMAVEEYGSFWTIDHLACDSDTARAATEWTLENRRIKTLLRGSEWYQFAASGRLQEVRVYLAVSPDRSRKHFELGGFDYAGRGYVTGSLEPGND